MEKLPLNPVTGAESQITKPDGRWGGHIAYAKYDRAVGKLIKDRDVLLTFYDFPADHWKHIRTSNPIESTFATVRHRTKKTKGCLGRKTSLAMTFRLMMSARKKWRKLYGAFRLPDIIEGVEFKDGIKQKKHAA